MDLAVARFDIVDPGYEAQQLVPYVDGAQLTELVTVFEASQHFDVVWKYAGLILGHFDFGDLSRYLHGEPRSWPGNGLVALLGCECGELGCWPLLAQVQVVGGRVVWDHLEQPYRKQRDYSGFGPFVFDEEQYRAAVARVVSALN